jgi:TPR repeat protein
MDSSAYFKVSEMERSGQTEEGFLLLERLAMEGDPLALLDLAGRYFSTEGFAHPVKTIESDERKSEELAIKAKDRLLELANAGDGEAMRMLATTYFGHWHPVHEKSFDEGEKWLLRAYEVACYSAANDLALFYLGKDIEKAKFYYQEAERHGCRVIHDDRLET